LYDEYLGIITKYKNLTSEQKESIGLCCLDATTTKYTKKDFAAKIEIEIKRIQESVIGQCAKNIGVVLETSKIEHENVKVSSNNVFSKGGSINKFSGSIKLSTSSSPKNPEWADGSCLVFTKEVFNSVEGFYEKFFMYFEDVDYCYRAKSRGFVLNHVDTRVSQTPKG
jgi:hypothetical protein